VSGDVNNSDFPPRPGVLGWRRLRQLLALLALLLLLAGCGTTQLSPASRRLLEALQTAVSAKNSQWLEAVARQVESQHAQSEMPSADCQVLQTIIAAARSGDWETAQSRALALSEGQRPSAEELARARQRQSVRP